MPGGKKVIKDPFNAEPTRTALISSYPTPVELLLQEKPWDEQLLISYRWFGGKAHRALIGRHQSADNRSTAMSNIKAVKFVGWDVLAIGNGMPFVPTLLTATWGGAKLADGLELVGIPKSTRTISSGGKHEENGGPYKASISLTHATNPEADVLLAYEMNKECQKLQFHGTIRVLVLLNGWIQSIYFTEECKMFPPSVNWENIDWSPRKPQMDFPVQSAICSLEDVDTVPHGKITVNGYVVSGGGHGIEGVNVSFAGGKT
ncbi:sulfite oxidase [Actinidia rufa]|uniref:Sulfite oxidase n=1 Tax=Actinidia rufa TaxID=165716 RepID=A0A7J0DGW6_9ERIC|nr:sulfite oxidase [Actinidia rufa]